MLEERLNGTWDKPGLSSVANEPQEASSENLQEARALPLFYRDPRPLTAADHGALTLSRDAGYDFARGAHAVLLQLAEFQVASGQLPILFTEDPQPLALALLGLRGNENLFVDAEGRWAEGCYVPAYIRRYPFLPARCGAGETAGQVLCIDAACSFFAGPGEAYEGDARDGEPLFVGGAPSSFTREMTRFCEAYEQQGLATTAFLTELAARELLETAALTVTFPGGDKGVVKGLRIIDRQRFEALPDEVFLDWRRKGWVAAIYWHWASLSALPRLAARG